MAPDYPAAMSVIVDVVSDARLQELGRRLRSIRTAAGQSQTQVATTIGVHRTHLLSIEAGRENITIGTLYRLADYFDVRVGELLPN
jgi:transcriptional regulator with XRE-family HTH domain